MTETSSVAYWRRIHPETFLLWDQSIGSNRTQFPPVSMKQHPHKKRKRAIKSKRAALCTYLTCYSLRELYNSWEPGLHNESLQKTKGNMIVEAIVARPTIMADNFGITIYTFQRHEAGRSSNCCIQYHQITFGLFSENHIFE